MKQSQIMVKAVSWKPMAPVNTSLSQENTETIQQN